MPESLTPQLERQLRQLITLQLAIIAASYGPAVAARLLAGLQAKYEKQAESTAANEALPLPS